MTKKLDKRKTGIKIIKHCQSNAGMSIDTKKFWQEFKTVKDFKEACTFCGISPVYVE